MSVDDWMAEAGVTARTAPVDPWERTGEPQPHGRRAREAPVADAPVSRRTERRLAIERRLRAGDRPVDIAADLGLTPQRIYQIRSELLAGVR